MRSLSATVTVKALIAVALLELMLPALGRMGPLRILWLALAVAALTYVVADRMLLSGVGNATAVLADFGLGVLALFILPRLAPGPHLSFGGALTAGGALTVAEILYHQYLLRKGVGTP